MATLAADSTARICSLVGGLSCNLGLGRRVVTGVQEHSVHTRNVMITSLSKKETYGIGQLDANGPLLLRNDLAAIRGLSRRDMEHLPDGSLHTKFQ